MAYHEQHERKCPHCGERISATTPKCFNCGRYVDEDEEDDEEEPDHSRATIGLVLGVVGALICVGVVVFLFAGGFAGCNREGTTALPSVKTAQQND